MAFRLLSKIQSLFGADKVVSGVVVATHHYLPRPPASDIATVGTGKDERFVQGESYSDFESWSVTVRGVDMRGNGVTEEICVPWDVWSTTQVGNKWPHT